MHPTGRTALYRLFAESGVLLYIGVSNDPEVRYVQHAADKPWWPEVVTMTTEWFDTRVQALAAETAAIKAEDPLHNRQHSPSYRRPVAPGTPLTALKARFTDFVNRVLYRNEVLYVTKNGRRVAAVVPVEVAERYEAEQRRTSGT